MMNTSEKLDLTHFEECEPSSIVDIIKKVTFLELTTILIESTKPEFVNFSYVLRQYAKDAIQLGQDPNLIVTLYIKWHKPDDCFAFELPLIYALNFQTYAYQVYFCDLIDITKDTTSKIANLIDKIYIDTNQYHEKNPNKIIAETSIQIENCINDFKNIVLFDSLLNLDGKLIDTIKNYGLFFSYQPPCCVDLKHVKVSYYNAYFCISSSNYDYIYLSLSLFNLIKISLSHGRVVINRIGTADSVSSNLDNFSKEFFKFYLDNYLDIETGSLEDSIKLLEIVGI